jgi:hypothetical protein
VLGWVRHSVLLPTPDIHPVSTSPSGAIATTQNSLRNFAPPSNLSNYGRGMNNAVAFADIERAWRGLDAAEPAHAVRVTVARRCLAVAS